MARVRAAIENARSSRGGGPAPLLDTLADLAAGFGCGVFATAFNAPFDVAKSRQQSQLPPPNPQRYHGVLHTLATIAREEVRVGSDMMRPPEPSSPPACSPTAI